MLHMLYFECIFEDEVLENNLRGVIIAVRGYTGRRVDVKIVSSDLQVYCKAGLQVL